MVVLPPALVAENNSGEFCRLLGPPSRSHESFCVTPSSLRSIPSPALEWTELERMALPVFEPVDTATPASPLKAMVLPAPEPVPPTVLFSALIRTPQRKLPSASPPALVPIKFPCT